MTRLRPLRQPTIRDVVRDWFPSFTDPSWAPWHTFLGAVFGLELDTDEIGRYRHCTGRRQAPTQPVREVWTIVGRRGGKSQVAALLTVFLALFRRYTLARGERGVVMVLAADRRQARVVMRYIGGLIDAVPALAAKITRRTAEAIDFNNGISVEIHTSSFRSVRGYTVVAAILDEVAYWPTEESAAPDSEVVTALRPAMATVPGALLVAISSPYARRGELYWAHRDHFGTDGDDVLVWQADTRTMNPAIDPTIIERAYATDEAAASAEWGAQFRRDVESFLTRDVIERLTVPGRRSRGSQVSNPAGRANTSVFLNEPRVRASVLARQHPPETVIFRVAGRVAGVFAWQSAWHAMGRSVTTRVAVRLAVKS